MTTVDPEKSRPLPPEYAAGYPDFSAYVASDKELAIYRRFDRPSTRNLQYFQSEILDLERQLDAFDADDLKEQKSQDLDAAMIPRRWETFVEKAEIAGSKEEKKMKLIKKLRPLIKEYHEALLLQSQVLNLPDPAPRPLSALLSYFNRERPLLGTGWNLLPATDLAALRPAPGQDRLSRFLQDYCGYLFASPSSAPPIPASWRPAFTFPEQRVARVVAIISILLSAILLVGAIVALYYVQGTAGKMGMIAGFTTVFAGSVGALTRAGRVEVWGASAAYAAVLVVFVSGNLANSGSGKGKG